MDFEDFRKLANSATLFSLERAFAQRLIKVTYFLGLGAIALWAFTHFYMTFSYSFGSGLWGLIEIAVYGLFAFGVLRIACEAATLFFKVHADAAPRPSRTGDEAVSLVDELRDAIEELAEDEDAKSQNTAGPSRPSGAAATARTASTARKAAPKRRTAKRTPKSASTPKKPE